jgi:transposase
VIGPPGAGLDRSGLDLARARMEEAAKAYRRARSAADRGSPAGLRASRAELVRRRAALAAELERVGGLACPTAEAAAPLAVAFRDAWEALDRASPLARAKAKRRTRALPQ